MKTPAVDPIPVLRFSWQADAAARARARALPLLAVSAALGAVLGRLDLWSRWPDLAILPFWVAFTAAAMPPRGGAARLATALVAVVGLLLGAPGDGWAGRWARGEAVDISTLSPLALLGVAAAAGALVAGPAAAPSLGSRAQAALAALALGGFGAALAGTARALGWAAAPAGLAQGLAWGLAGLGLLALGAAQVRTVSRPPAAATVRAQLPAPFAEPALRAVALDAALASRCPDASTRDGVGEVAAWVVRLQGSLAALAAELEAVDAANVTERINALTADAATATDPFTRDRHLAAAEHLGALLRHRDALVAEQARTAALSAYAGAWLEEARAGLAVAAFAGAEVVPPGLGDVLDRLRSHAADSGARRRTAWELQAAGVR